MSNCQHASCTGPVCTKANVPNRPLIGVSRDRAAIVAAVKDQVKCYRFEAKGGRITMGFLSIGSLVTAMMGAETAIRAAAPYTDSGHWTYTMKAEAEPYIFELTIRLEHVKK